MTYVMNSRMYYTLIHDRKDRLIRDEKEVITHINNTFGLKGKVTKLEIR